MKIAQVYQMQNKKLEKENIKYKENNEMLKS